MWLKSLSSMGFGVGRTTLDVLQSTTESIQDSIVSVFLAMTSANVGGWLCRLGPREHRESMRYALVTGTAIMGLAGAIHLRKGITQKSISKILEGSVTLLAGAVGSVLAFSLDSRIIVIAHQASILGVTSSLIGILGFKDLKKGHYYTGMCKVALGIAGVAGAVFYVHHSTFQLDSTLQLALPENERDFLALHEGEIEEMYGTQTLVGRWKNLGSGEFKRAIIHKDFPGMLVKIPNPSSPFSEEKIRLHQDILKAIRPIAANFDRIVLPRSYSYHTAKGLVLVEQRFDLDYFSKDCDREETVRQLRDFLWHSRLCDAAPQWLENGGIIRDSCPPLIAFIDFDCRRSGPSLFIG